MKLLPLNQTKLATTSVSTTTLYLQPEEAKPVLINNHFQAKTVVTRSTRALSLCPCKCSSILPSSFLVRSSGGGSINSFCCIRKSRANATGNTTNVEQEGEENYRVLTAVRSDYNDIVIVDTPKSRMLLLDSTHNVHSILNKGDQKWTNSYWDEFATLPAIIPEGPVAMLGLGGGTAACLMLDIWPSLQLHGWEIDHILIDKAREHFGLSDLEKATPSGGILHVHIGDALGNLGRDSVAYAGIVVDLFCEGKVLDQLQEVSTWLRLKEQLIPNGRIMVNCGGSDVGVNYLSSYAGTRFESSVIRALSDAFPGQISWKRMSEGQGANYMALTGPLPNLTEWSTKVPSFLSESVKQWRPCTDLSL